MHHISINYQVDWGTVAKYSGVVSRVIVKNLQRGIRERIVKQNNQKRLEKIEMNKRQMKYAQRPIKAVVTVAHGYRTNIFHQWPAHIDPSRYRNNSFPTGRFKDILSP